jgi:oxygen-independent coproporphyrinogen-3 oxidase
MKKHQRLIDEAVLPGAAARLAQAEAAAAVLTGAGFVPIGLDHFARPDDPLARAQRAGRLRRNFQGYTDDDAGALIGLGPSAISALPQGYLQNLPDLAGHARAVHEGRLATARGLRLTPDDRLRGAIIERLMCDLTVDVGSVCRAHRMDTARLRSSFAALAPLVADGLVQVEGRRVTVPESARPFMRLAASAFDAYLQSEGARYSRAV